MAKKQPRDKQPKEPKTDWAFWSQDEEKLLAKCFIEINKDPKNESDQARDTFWYKILTIYNQQADQLGFKSRNKNMLTDKYKWTNPESTQARRTRGRVTGEDEPEMFGEDVIPRPSGAPRKSKSQRSSASSSATSGSSKNRLTGFFQEQIQMDREAKKESLDRELAARLAVVELQKINKELKILTFDTTGMNPEDAARIEALKEKARATYFNF
ncbi:hypothetical protein Tco_0714552 [Tanacetum coccineum]